MVVQRWRRNDYIYESRRSASGASKKIPWEVEQRITAAKSLYDTAHMSLRERALYYQQQFGAPLVAASTLARLFKRNGISYRSARYSYVKKGERQAELQAKQQEFAQVLTGWMHQGREVVFLDETSFHRWQSLRRTWLKPSMSVAIPNSRGSSVTLIGAISSQQGLIHAEVFSGCNNLSRFLHFLATLLRRVPPGSVVVMDNLSIHKSLKVRELFPEDRLLAYLPPFSCALNPIERLWAVLKQEWRRVVVSRGTKLSASQSGLEEEIQGILQ